MNAKVKYDSIIQTIEDGARDPDLSTSELMDEVLRQSGMGARELNSVMVFLTEGTLRSYIVYRKMMAAYQSIFEAEEFDVEKAEEISGYDNQSSFTKAFTKTFGMAPKETFKKRGESLYIEPLMWDCISGNVTSQINIAKEIQPVKDESVFGIEPEQYAKAMEASELQELYGFNRVYSQVAFDVSVHWEIPLKDAFEYMESWRGFIEEDYTLLDPLCASLWLYNKPGTIQNEPDFEVILREKLALDEMVKFMYFSVGLSVTLSIMTMARLVGLEQEITEIEPFLIYEYAQTEDFNFNVFLKDYQYFKNKLNAYEYDWDDFKELFDAYVDLLCGGMNKEEAFVYTVGCPPPLSVIEELNSISERYVFEKRYLKESRTNTIEREAAEIDRWNNNEPPIDIDYDPDNPDPYDDDDPWLLDDEDLKRRKDDISDPDNDEEFSEDEDFNYD